MPENSSPLIVLALTTPEKTLDFTLSEWNLTIRQARRAGVLARLGEILEKNIGLNSVPEAPRKHIQSALIHYQQFKISLNWEIQCIEKALANVSAPLVFLKGAAYVLANDASSVGRIFTDIDILVPKSQLDEVEQMLLFFGWKPGLLDDYDQHYYREWMHEIPPLTHVQRHTTIDVHHNILPSTTENCPDAQKLFENLVKVSDKNSWILAPEDRVIHSATHLFHDGELHHGFRDLSDLDLLLKDFSRDENFWQTLLQRANELQQQIPLLYALRYANLIFKTPINESVFNTLQKGSPSKIKQKFMDFLFLRVLLPEHSSCEKQWTGLASWLIFVRSHWLRMPIHLLIPHLARKSWMQFTGKSDY
jgi:hypothetical protein